MNPLLYSDHVILAESIFEKMNSLAGDAKSTALILFAAGFFVGAIITWAKSGFSVKSGIVALIMVAVGLGLLGQVDSLKTLFSDTVSTTASSSLHQPAIVASSDLEGPVTLVVGEPA